MNTPDPQAPHQHDDEGIPLWFCLIGIGLAIALGAGLFWIKGESETNWIGIASIAIAVGLYVLAVVLFKDASSPHGKVGPKVIVGMVLTILATALVILTITPPPEMRRMNAALYPYVRDHLTKPHLTETAPPAEPKLKWMKLELPDGKGADKVFAQIEMTKEEATQFPVLESVLEKKGHIISWYERGNKIESKADDY